MKTWAKWVLGGALFAGASALLVRQKKKGDDDEMCFCSPTSSVKRYHA